METVSNENSLSKDTDAEDNDLVLKLKKLSDRVALHETEKQKMREEFGQQRAKMKELFLQKEDELKKESNEHDRLKDVIKQLEADLNESRTQLTVVSLELESQIEEERRRYREEVASLQHLITETVDESSRNEEEVKRLKRLNEKLEAELEELRHCGGVAGDTGGGTGTGAQLLTAPTAKMITTLARRVVSQLGADSSVPPSSLQSQTTSVMASENLEESMRKVNKYAQEDAEVLRSLVIPLEEEIKALKDKLRENDEKLRKYEHDSVGKNDSDAYNFNRNTKVANSDGLMTEGKSLIDATLDQGPVLAICPPKLTSHQTAAQDDIFNLQSQSLSMVEYVGGSDDGNARGVTVTDNRATNQSSPSATDHINSDENHPPYSNMRCEMCANYEAQLVAAEEKFRDLEKQVATLERCKEELSKEVLIRKDMEQKWIEKKELHKNEVVELQAKVNNADAALKEMKELYKNTKTQVTEELKRLIEDRRNAQLQLDRLQLENENLVGKRNANARELQDEVINLPDNVEELQEMLLKCREDLISARVGQEAAEQEVTNLRKEAQCLRYQTQAENQTRLQLMSEIDSLKSDLRKTEAHYLDAQLVIQRLNNEEKSMRLEMEDLKMQLISTSNAKKQLDEKVCELKNSLSSMKTELHNSEIVQQDFVRLSQSLQQELERIRSSHTQVRWEHDDDIDQCPGCRQSFGGPRRKQHCKHCGRIFCAPCLTHSVLSGPNQRPSKVCDVCHTLLVKDTAPYFSTEPPHSNN